MEILTSGAGALFLLAGAGIGLALAAGTGADTARGVDPAPCLAAIAGTDDSRIVSACGALIEDDRTGEADRIRALAGRAAAFARQDRLEPAIADCDAALRLDPTLADIFNARGELWWRAGERRKALADFADALKLSPDQAAAKSNYKRLALELERLGAQMAVTGKPSFDCRAARQPVETAICADPALADLDRAIHAAYEVAVREAAGAGPRAVGALQREQDEFLERRSRRYGRPGYDLAKAMHERLEHLLSEARR